VSKLFVGRESQAFLGGGIRNAPCVGEVELLSRLFLLDGELDDLSGWTVFFYGFAPGKGLRMYKLLFISSSPPVKQRGSIVCSLVA
jgi:hypothetical protein